MPENARRDTAYAKLIAQAEYGPARIERLTVKGANEGKGQDELRFSWWPEGRMANRPLDVTEDELLALFRDGIPRNVFSPGFLQELHSLLFKVRHPEA